MPPDFLDLNDLSKILKIPTKVKKAKSKTEYFRTWIFDFFLHVYVHLDMLGHILLHFQNFKTKKAKKAATESHKIINV